MPVSLLLVYGLLPFLHHRDRQSAVVLTGPLRRAVQSPATCLMHAALTVAGIVVAATGAALLPPFVVDVSTSVLGGWTLLSCARTWPSHARLRPHDQGEQSTQPAPRHASTILRGMPVPPSGTPEATMSSLVARGSSAPPAPVPPHQRGLLTEQIARHLERDIRSGDIAVGEKLPSERELAIQFRASRNVVREVLRRLEAQNLIEVAPGRGSFVSEHSSAQARGYDALYRAERPTVRQLIEARTPLEVEIVGLAAERATDADLAVMAAANERMATARDVVAKARADLDFHDAVAVASGNPVLRVMLSSISGLMFEMMLRSNSDPLIEEEGVPHHPEIFEALRAHDVELSRYRMREHLALGLRTYGSDLDISLDVMATRHIETLLRSSQDR